MAKKTVTPTVWRRRVAKHLAEFGDAEWDKFKWNDELPYATRRRHVRSIKAEFGLLKPTVATVKETAKSLQETMIEVEDATSGTEPIGLMKQVNRMLFVCDLLDSHAVDFDAQVVRDPQDAREALKTRAAVLTLAINAQDKLYSLTKIQTVHQMMLDSIKQESPEAAGRILNGLKKIDREYGLALL